MPSIQHSAPTWDGSAIAPPATRPVRRLLVGLALALLPLFVQAEYLDLPPQGEDLVGRMRYVKAKQGDTLIDIAHDHSVGQDEIVMANPTVSRWLPGEGTKVLIPDRFVLPDAPRTGIVVNIPEMRMYFFPPGEGTNPATQVVTYPISVGRMDWKSPMGITKIVEKIKDPTWTPPESIKREHALDGEILPDVVPAGPDNPLGQFAMRLGVKGSYLIHGTGQDKADGIGMMVTHGCMRMYPEDVAQLFPKVKVGTQVNLIYQSVKVGWGGNDLYIEVSQPLEEDHLGYDKLLAQATPLIQKKIAERPGTVINQEALRHALQKPNGIPTPITGSAAQQHDKFPVTPREASTDTPESAPQTAAPVAPAPTPAPAPMPKAPAAASVSTQPLWDSPGTTRPTASQTIINRPVPAASPAPVQPVARPVQSAPAYQPTQAPAAPPVRANSKPDDQLLPPIY